MTPILQRRGRAGAARVALGTRRDLIRLDLDASLLALAERGAIVVTTFGHRADEVAGGPLDWAPGRGMAEKHQRL